MTTANRQFGDILTAVAGELGEQQFPDGCAPSIRFSALSARLFGRDVVLNILARQRDVDPPLPVATPTHRRPWPWRSSRWPIAPATTSCAVRCRPRRPTVERHEIIELMGQLKLAGMRAAYDEAVAAGVRAQHPFQRIIGELLLAQLADNRARSTAYRLGVARFPVMKNLAEFDFSVSPVNRIPPRAAAFSGLAE